MNEQYLNHLAEGLLSLIEHEDPSEQNIGVRGTALINEFIRKPGIEESLAQLDVERKRYDCGEAKDPVCRSYFTVQIHRKRGPRMITDSLGRSTFK